MVTQKITKTHTKYLYNNKYVCLIVCNTISGTWVTSALLAFSPFLGWGVFKYIPLQSACLCDYTKSLSHTIYLCVFTACIPFCIVLFSYINIIRTSRKSKERLKTTHKLKPGNDMNRIQLSCCVKPVKVKTHRRRVYPKIETKSEAPLSSNIIIPSP